MTPTILAHLKNLAAAFDPAFPPAARAACLAEARAIRAALSPEDRERLARLTARYVHPESGTEADLGRIGWHLYRMAQREGQRVTFPRTPGRPLH